MTRNIFSLQKRTSGAEKGLLSGIEAPAQKTFTKGLLKMDDTPEEILLRKERNSRIDLDFGYLSKLDKQIILMRLEKNPLSFVKIGVRLGVPGSTVHRRYHKALKQIGGHNENKAH